MSQVIGLLRLLGWRYYHTFLSVRSVAGFPDIVAIRPPRIVYLECKTQRGIVSPEQIAWLADLTAAGQEAYVIRPADLDWLRDKLLEVRP